MSAVSGARETGRIVQSVGGFYYVSTAEGEERVCKARGRFRKDGETPLVGDEVAFVRQRAGEDWIAGILPRKNAFVRPPVANIDQLVVVCAASLPRPDLLLLDKLLLSANLAGVRPLVALNKYDEADEPLADAFRIDYGRFFPLYIVSAETGEGLDALSDALRGRVSCFAGQSAVGKSSLLNALVPECGQAVGSLSEKTEHGRHTTRQATLIPYRGGAVVDTPGFSLYDPETLSQSALNACYPEFEDAPARCRFAGCAHVSEPDCAVKALVEAGAVSPGRYARYKLLQAEFEQRSKHRYD